MNDKTRLTMFGFIVSEKERFDQIKASMAIRYAEGETEAKTGFEMHRMLSSYCDKLLTKLAEIQTIEKI